MPDWESLTRALVFALEKSRIREYANLLGSNKRLIMVSFISGIFRGLGYALGFSVLGALALLVLKQVFGIDFS